MGTLQESLGVNLHELQSSFGKSSDLIVRPITLGTTENLRAAILYVEGLTDSAVINEFIVQPIMDGIPMPESGAVEIMQLLMNEYIAVDEVVELQDYQAVCSALLAGRTILLVNGATSALSATTTGWKDRNVMEPSAQTVIRGPREGFTETLRTNTALVRRKIRSESLWCEERTVGTVTKTRIALLYLNGIANPKVVEEVRRRLDGIDTDAILEGGYIEEFIQDEYLTPFPTIYNTERPDVVAAGLLEGRIALIVDGTPFVLLVPVVFGQFFQAAEDYYQRFDIAIFLRWLRYLCFFISLLGPSLYIAITTFHQEMIPTQLLISLASQREGIPFPAFIEALMMEIAFEILREAGVRMPRAVGQAISIVGALVLGQAAVEAGIVSAAMVIVVSITAIANFVFPAINMAIPIRLLRFAMMALAASFGLYGITLGLLAMVLHLCSLRSFGIPYMAPFGPLTVEGQQDMMIRSPHWDMKKRPAFLRTGRSSRTRSPAPAPPENSDEGGLRE